jgi:chemotaxis protein MotB
MQESGLGERQVAQVRGFADQLLRTPEKPDDPSNRRISLIVQYTTKEDLERGNTEHSVKVIKHALRQGSTSGRESPEERQRK